MKLVDCCRIGVALGCILGMAGCGANHYRRSADAEVYGAIRAKGAIVPNTDPKFSIDQTNTVSLEGLPRVPRGEEFLGIAQEAETGSHVVSLEKALELAIHHNRQYQTSKEQLYLSALSLTLARHRFAPLFSAGGNARLSGQTEQAQTVTIDEFTGQPKVELSDTLVERTSGSASGSVGAEWLIRDLGRISAAFATDFSRFLSGNPGTVTSSRLSATFVRPLLRNAGYKAEVENLTQSERDLLYALRTFSRFRRDFTVQIASEYYAVLGARDAARNSYANLEKSQRTGERTRALAEEGRTTQADLGRIEQQVLTAENAWIGAIRTYRQALDNFKIRLGLSTDAAIVLADRELEELTIRHPSLTTEDAIRVALAARLDYQNARDAVEDATRKVALAADGLKAQVDLVANVSLSSKQGETTGIPLPDPERYRWTGGFDLDLPLNRKLERNAYRASLIAQAQAIRGASLLEDEIKLEVRDAWRTLEQAKRSYEISEIGVKLAERRVEEQELLAELGRARAQDQVDSQNSLLTSMNERTQALVAHTIARLRFWNSMGILFVKENGQWQEGPSAKGN